MDDLPAGTVICHNYTRGHHAPVTISTGPVAKFLGRTDIAPYIVSLTFFFTTGATVPMWWASARNAFGFRTAGFIVIGICVGSTIVAFMVTHATNVKVRDLPRKGLQAWGLLSAAAAQLAPAGTGGYSGEHRIAPEPRISIRARDTRAWFMPVPTETE